MNFKYFSSLLRELSLENLKCLSSKLIISTAGDNDYDDNTTGNSWIDKFSLIRIGKWLFLLFIFFSVCRTSALSAVARFHLVRWFTRAGENATSSLKSASLSVSYYSCPSWPCTTWFFPTAVLDSYCVHRSWSSCTIPWPLVSFSFSWYLPPPMLVRIKRCDSSREDHCLLHLKVLSCSTCLVSYFANSTHRV